MSSTGKLDIGERIVRAARKYIGVPFHHQGRSVLGIDCVGLDVAVARDLGLHYVDFGRYGRNPNPRQLLGVLSKSCDRVSRPGDPLCLDHDDGAWQASVNGQIVLFWIMAPNMPQHSAFRTPRGMLHTWAGARKVVEHGMTDYWRSRAHSLWQYRGAATWQR